MKKIIKKTTLIGIVLLEIVALNIYPAQAFLGGLLGGSAPNSNDIFGQMEERYHLNRDSIMDAGENFNVSSQKGNAPEVDIFFNPTSPKFGEKITATALPKFFQSDAKQMYFTWYLKHADCPIASIGSEKYNEKCDLNNDRRVNQEDWKIEAMKIIVQNGFIQSKAEYDSDDDSDGYKAKMGQNNLIQKEARCYIHDFESGADYEIAHLKDGVDAPNKNKKSQFECEGTMMCTSDFRLSCGGQEGTIGVPEQDIGSASATGGDGGTGTGGDASVSLTIPEHDEEIDYKSITMFDVVRDSGFEPYCKPTEGEPGTGVATCPEGTTARCITDSRTVEPTCDFIGDMTARVCGTEGADPGACCSGDLCIRTNPTAFSDPGESGTIACTTQTVSVEDIEQSCEHLFPDTNGNGTVGDGEYGLDEEEFWGTNPHDPSTAGNDQKDEENLAGVGKDKFTWTYLPGDQVGVIVEGIALYPTKHDDSSSKIMWALPNNVFEKDGDDECFIAHEHGNKTGGDDGENKYTEEVKGYDVEINYASTNINGCLKYNLIDPMKGGQPDNMETVITYNPKNPNKGDKISLVADTANGGENRSQLYYRWSVYGSDKQSLDMEDWVELSADAGFRSANGISLLEGLGLDTFEMSLQDFEYKYLRVFVEIEEYYSFGESQDTTRTGKSDVIIQVGEMSDNELSLRTADGADICAEGVCQVIGGQVVEASLDQSGLRNFKWTLNGKPINYLNGDEVAQGNMIRFPILGNPGDRYVLEVVANDTAPIGEEGNQGNKVILNRTLVVAKPRVKLGPVNNLDSDSCPSAGGLTSRRLGTYNGLNGESTADCSQTVFDASGSVAVPITFYPSAIQNSVQDAKWYINGVEQNDGNIDLSRYPQGAIISVSYKAHYVPSDRSELANTWGVSQLDTSGIVLSDSIKIRVGASGSQQTKSKASKVFATLIYNLPTQALFLLKVALTVAVIIFSAGITMSFFDDKKVNKAKL